MPTHVEEREGGTAALSHLLESGGVGSSLEVLEPVLLPGHEGAHEHNDPWHPFKAVRRPSVLVGLFLLLHTGEDWHSMVPGHKSTLLWFFGESELDSQSRAE